MVDKAKYLLHQAGIGPGDKVRAGGWARQRGRVYVTGCTLCYARLRVWT